MGNDEAAAGAERRVVTQRMVRVLPRFAMLVDATREFDTPYGPVGFRQLSVLYALRYQLIPADSVSPSMLAEFYSIKPSVVTRVLAKLEEHELIVRRPNQSDGRSFHVDITDKGREVSIHVEELYLDWMADGISFVPDEELAEFRETLERLDHLADRLAVRLRQWKRMPEYENQSM